MAGNSDNESITTEQILRLDHNDPNDNNNAALVSRLRSDLQHERNIRKDYETRLQELRTEFEESRRRSRELTNQVARIHTELNLLRQEKSTLEHRCHDLTHDITKLTESVDYYKKLCKEEIWEKDNEIKLRIQTEEKDVNLQALLEESEKHIKHLTKEKQSFLLAEEQFRIAIVDRDKKIKRLNKEIDEYNSRLSESSQIAQNLRNDRSEHVLDTEKLREQLANSNREKEELLIGYKTLKSDMTTLKARIKKTERDNTDLKIENEKLEKDIQRREEKNVELDREKEALFEEVRMIKEKERYNLIRMEENHLITENELHSVKEALKHEKTRMKLMEDHNEEMKKDVHNEKISMKEEICSLKEKLAQELKVNTVAKEKVQGVTDKLEKLSSEKKILVKKLKKERRLTHEKVEVFAFEAETARNRIQTLEPMFEKMTIRVEELAEDREQLQIRLNMLEKENMKLNKEIKLTHEMSINHLKTEKKVHQKSLENQALKHQDSELKNQLELLKTQYKNLHKDHDLKDKENLIYFSSIQKLEQENSSLNTKIECLESKNKSTAVTLKKLTEKADTIARDAQSTAKQERERSQKVQEKYYIAVQKLRERDLKIERLKSQMQLEKTLDLLEN